MAAAAVDVPDCAVAVWLLGLGVHVLVGVRVVVATAVRVAVGGVPLGVRVGVRVATMRLVATA